jgi:hypothetical protein
MPYEFSDPRNGLYQAVSISSYIHEKYDGQTISGTRIAFNIIGPFTEKWVYPTIYSEKDFIVALERGIPIVLSSLEIKLIWLNESDLYNYCIVYNSLQYLMLMG